MFFLYFLKMTYLIGIKSNKNFFLYKLTIQFILFLKIKFFMI